MRRLGIIGGGIHFGIISLTQPFFSLYAAELGASTALIGMMLMLKAVFPLFIAMPVGQMIDRIGAVKMLGGGNAITVLSLLVMVWSPNLPLLALSQLFIGAGTMIMASALQVIVSEGSKEERDRSITRYSAWCSGGNMAGPLIGGGIVALVTSGVLWGWSGTTELGYRTAFLVSFAAALVFGLTFRWRSRHAVKKQSSGGGMKEFVRPREIVASYMDGAHLFKHPGVQFGLVGTFLIHFIQSIWLGFFPLYLDSLGYSALAISILVSVRGMASLISRSFLGQLMKRFSQERILIGAGCIAALSLIVLPLLNWHLLMIALISFVLGCAVGINMPVSTMIMVDDTQSNERGKVMGLRLLANRFSQIAGPALFGVVGHTLGLGLAFCSGGGVLLASMLGFGAYSRLKHRQAGVNLRETVSNERIL
ncbi:MFS transporter [Paenibacillus abyssi]|uniref:MFS transporter n=1 Tax=Paenibacillus abyssi TaxID=1340531 RepID=A0A917CZ67_9BACL|nr:MFS transporter [Paenibacillus abyssi]GGG00662.1 MFS transporter [Paenibacillus abyssi]